MTILRSKDLNDFIRDADLHGGLLAPDFWERWGSLRYEPSTIVDQTLDPHGSQYFESMLNLYVEIAGQPHNPPVTELTVFDFDLHAAALTAYGQRASPNIALHFQRIASAIRMAKFERGATILDMGCGRGFASELLTQCGFAVTAVDINPALIELVRTRSARLNYPIAAEVSSFEDFRPCRKFDGVLFYECLHHAAKPWQVIADLASLLADGGQLVLAGEPIQDMYWKHWGLRLDAMSVYCMRKFGWFESGWSMPFLTDMLARAGLLARVRVDTDPMIGPIVCAVRPTKPLDAADIAQYVQPKEWHLEGPFLISNGCGSIHMTPPCWVSSIVFEICNFRGRSVDLSIDGGGRSLAVITLAPGTNLVRCAMMTPHLTEFLFHGETWIPSRELSSTDDRQISFHLSRMTFE